MKKIILLLLMLPILTLAQEMRTGKVFEAVMAEKSNSGNFQSFEVFNQQTRNALTNYSDGVNDGVIVTIDQTKINEILSQNPKQMQLTIPFKSNGETVALELIQVAVFSPDFKAFTDTGENITNTADFGKHYRGVIAGSPKSLVSISIFESEINGFISNTEGNYSIGKVEDSDIDHIIYKDSDLKAVQEFNCSTEDDGQGYTTEQLSTPNPMDPGDILDIYVESGHGIYTAGGSNLNTVVTFISGVYAQVFALYANDGILARNSSMMIWTTIDPYNASDSSGQLSIFQQRIENGQLDADLGCIIERQPGAGGVAAGFSGICASNVDDSLCFSGLQNLAFANVPTYSWGVYVISHEMGHIMGSRHTHACVWNGDNTAIDGCSGFTEGGCPLPGNPAAGGTIMSYCHLANGINFNEGFGPQPTAVILNNINANGNCLDQEGVLIPPTAVCKSYQVVLDSNGEASIVAADIDGGSFDDDGIDTMTIDIDTFDCGDVGDVAVTLTVTDTDGLSTFCVTLVEVIDDTDVVISGCPDDFEVIVNTGDTYELLDYRDDISATTDICTVTLVATSQTPSAGTQLAVGIHTITVSALLNEDGDIGSCTFDITVVDGLGLGDNTALSSLVLYPNPTSEFVQLSNPQNLDLETISIYDMMGRLIKLVDLKDMGIEMSINISDLADSNYFAIIQGAQNKIIKQLIKR